MPSPIDGLRSPLPPSKKKEGTIQELSHPIYADAKMGPFRCDNCEHYVSVNKCDHPEIIKLRKGNVEPGACCDYFEKKGK